MQYKIALVKIAAIGDVAMACRALNDFLAKHEFDVELHWIIDQKLRPLAEALLKILPYSTNLSVHWYTIDATALFQGSFLKKAQVSTSVAKSVLKIQPHATLILHRDTRYRLAIRPAFFGKLISLKRENCHEIDLYSKAFQRLGSIFGLKKRSELVSNVGFHPTSSPTKKVGVLIGGAQNQKVFFKEKRWPGLKEFLRLLLEKSDRKIVLFGGPDDKSLEEEILREIFSDPISAERVESFVGKRKLEELPEVLRELDSFVSIDSGLAHIASVVMNLKHQSLVALFGPTDPNIWAPKPSGECKLHLFYKGAVCSPCYANAGTFPSCRFEGEYFQHCMKDLSADAALKAILG